MFPVPSCPKEFLPNDQAKSSQSIQNVKSAPQETCFMLGRFGITQGTHILRDWGVFLSHPKPNWP